MTPLPALQRLDATLREPQRAVRDAIALREKRYPPLRIAIAVQALVEGGANAAALLAGTGLDETALDDPDVRVSSLQLLSVANNAVRQGCGSDAGLRVGLRYHPSCYGMLGYAVLCSVSLRQAFDTSKRYIRLGNSMLDFDWNEGPESAVWTVPSFDELRLPDLSPELYRFIRDMSLASLMTVFKDVMGPWCIPLRVAFTGSPPPHADALASAFKCPLAFNQPRNEMHYPLAWLDRAPQLANAITAAQMSRACARMVEEFKWQPGLTRRVYHELTCTPGQFPDIETVAATLCMTSRTLRRKLEAEGTSYSDLLDGVRHALALDYLGTPMLSAADIAAALGFSDTASFRRAFKRWTGASPADFRARRQAAAPVPSQQRRSAPQR
jgi:AraC-like DNA-binding protein